MDIYNFLLKITSNLHVNIKIISFEDFNRV